MSSDELRVAYFPDSFHEMNGVAHTSRHFEAFARNHRRPFLCVRAGTRIPALIEEGSVQTLELPRSSFSFPIEKDLRFDLAFWRHAPCVMRTLRAFRPDLVHITGPSDVGMLGAWAAAKLKVPLVASWHTNVHEYAARRAGWFTRLFGPRRASFERQIEATSLWLSARFYRLARVLFAPNNDLCRLLERATRRPCFLMTRGVDTQAFSPGHRVRSGTADELVLGFVGRLSIEKNLRLLVRVADDLRSMGAPPFRFLIIGHGAEEPWLRQHLPEAEFPGVLRGPELARAYANMDIFVFPSHTDTFGNVVLEALASGVPAIVTPDGGPATIVRDGVTGFVTDDGTFTAVLGRLLQDQALRDRMRIAARTYALTASWDAVFESVYQRYQAALMGK